MHLEFFFGKKSNNLLYRWWFQIFCFIFIPIYGEMFQFDEHIFEMGSNHQLVYLGSTSHSGCCQSWQMSRLVYVILLNGNFRTFNDLRSLNLTASLPLENRPKGPHFRKFPSTPTKLIFKGKLHVSFRQCHLFFWWTRSDAPRCTQIPDGSRLDL